MDALAFRSDRQTKQNEEKTTPPISVIKVAAEGALICNELERLRLYQGNDVTLFEDWRSKYNEVSDIHYAAFYGDLASVQRLVKEGVDVTAPVEDGPKLLKAPKHKDEFGQTFAGFFLGATPLSMACQQGHLNVVRYLASHSNVNHADSIGLSPLMVAAAWGFIDIVKVLLSKGAKVDACDSHHGMTPLLFACAKNHSNMVKFLVNRRARISARDFQGRRGIHFAAWNYNIKLVEYFHYRLGVPIDVTDLNGNTPLQTLLTDMDLEPDGVDDVSSTGERRYIGKALHGLGQRHDLHLDIKRVVSRGMGTNGEEFHCLTRMVRLGAKVSHRNKLGQTPLHTLCGRLPPVTVSHGFLLSEEPKLNQTLLVLLQVLLRLGADGEARDRHGDTPRDLCEARNNWMAVRVISRFFKYVSRPTVIVEDPDTIDGSYSRHGWRYVLRQTTLHEDVEKMADAVLAAARYPTGVCTRWLWMLQ